MIFTPKTTMRQILNKKEIIRMMMIRIHQVRRCLMRKVRKHGNPKE